MSKRNAFATKSDGSAVDPRAYREALKRDPAIMARLKEHPTLLELVENGSDADLQKNLRDGLTAEYQDRGPLELSREVLRARGRFPLDVVALYQAMDEMGLNYGPSFQAIETLHCGDPQQEAGSS